MALMTNANEQLRAAAHKLTHPTDPEPAPAYPEVLAERYGASGTGAHARLYATLHAVMNFLLANPHLPVPTSVTFGAHVDTLEDLDRMATAHNTVAYPPEDRSQVGLWPLGQPSIKDEFYVRLLVSLKRKDRPL